MQLSQKLNSLEIFIANQLVGKFEIIASSRIELTIANERFKVELERLHQTLRETPIPHKSNKSISYLQPQDDQYLQAVAHRLASLQWQNQILDVRIGSTQEKNE